MVWSNAISPSLNSTAHHSWYCVIPWQPLHLSKKKNIMSFNSKSFNLHISFSDSRDWWSAKTIILTCTATCSKLHFFLNFSKVCSLLAAVCPCCSSLLCTTADVPLDGLLCLACMVKVPTTAPMLSLWKPGWPNNPERCTSILRCDLVVCIYLTSSVS